MPGPIEADPPRFDRFLVQKPRQVFRQLAGGRVAVGWPLGQRLEHDGLEVARHPAVDLCSAAIGSCWPIWSISSAAERPSNGGRSVNSS